LTPGREDILIIQGSGFLQDFIYLDTEGDAVDLTDWGAVGTVKAYVYSSASLLDMESGSEITLGNDGKISILLTAEQTAEIEFPPFMSHGSFPAVGSSCIPPNSFCGKLGVWDLKLFPPESDGQPFVLLTGIACFVKSPSSAVLTCP